MKTISALFFARRPSQLGHHADRVHVPFHLGPCHGKHAAHRAKSLLVHIGVHFAKRILQSRLCCPNVRGDGLGNILLTAHGNFRRGHGLGALQLHVAVLEVVCVHSNLARQRRDRPGNRQRPCRVPLAAPKIAQVGPLASDADHYLPALGVHTPRRTLYAKLLLDIFTDRVLNRRAKKLQRSVLIGRHGVLRGCLVGWGVCG